MIQLFFLCKEQRHRGFPLQIFEIDWKEGDCSVKSRDTGVSHFKYLRLTGKKATVL